MFLTDLDQYIDDPSPENTERLYRSLSEDQFNVHDLDISSRVLTSWRQHELIPLLDDSRWVNLTVFQLIWVMLVEDLRKMGIPIAKIKQIRDQIFEPIEFETDYLFDEDGKVKSEFFSFPSLTGEKPEVVAAELERIYIETPEMFESFVKHYRPPLFHLLVINILYRNQDHSLLVSSDGEVSISSGNVKIDSQIQEKTFQDLLREHRDEPILILPLRKYLYKLTTTEKYESRIVDLQILNPVEHEVIQMMRKGVLKELKIIFNQGKKYTDLVHTYTGKVDQKRMHEVIDRFKEKKHVQLIIKSSDGKTVQFEYQSRRRFHHE